MNTSKAKKVNSEKKGEDKQQKEVVIGSVSVENCRVVEGRNGDIVFFTLELNGLYIYNCRVATGKNGDFISFPQTKGKDDKYYNVVYGRLNKSDEEDILKEVERQINAE